MTTLLNLPCPKGVPQVATLAVAILLATADFSHAASTTYAWEGRINRSTDSSPDPWMIGPQGADFKLQTTVSRDALDDDLAHVLQAIFSTARSRLWINGEELSPVDNATLEFTDVADGIDTMSAAGLFSRAGQSAYFGSVVALGPSTFTFTQFVERPPSFPTVATIGSGAFVDQTYSTSVNLGTIVTVVPEPGVLDLALGGLAVAAIWRCGVGRGRP